MSIKTVLESFKMEDYNNIENINLINIFIEKYKIIEEEDNKVPIFTSTHKYSVYKSRKKEYKKKKVLWKKLEHENNIQKIESNIRSNLNKMNDDVYNDILDDLKKNLFESNNICIFDFFLNLLYDKVIYDKKFQRKYLDLLDELSNNNMLYNNYVKIYNEDGKYYWNIINNEKRYGPYENKKDAKITVRNKLNLNKLFLNVLKKEFKKRYDYIDEMEKKEDDDDKYKLKRKYIGVFEILAILYNYNKINTDLIIVVIGRLLEFNNLEYDIECLHIITQNISINKISKDKLMNIKNKFEKVEISKLSSRIKYLSYDISDLFENI